MPKQLITGLEEGDVARYVILCGEPERVPRIASALRDAKEVARVREYVVHEARIDDEAVTVASTGIGGPSTAVLIEELANLGARTMLRIGTSGGIADGLEKGDMVISTGAIRADGTSRSYAWPEYPASASHEVTLALIKAATAMGVRFSVGITFSVDGFYSENKIQGKDREPISMSHDGFQMTERMNRLRDAKAMGAKNIEMENAALFTLGNIFGLRTGAICIVSDLVPWRPTDKVIDFEENMAECIKVGTEALSILIDWDRKKGGAEFYVP